MDKHTEKSLHGGDVYRNQVELDFSVNINPFGMPDGVKKALCDAIFLCTQYPDEKVSKLSEAMAKKLDVPQECLLFGNGASELFVAIIHARKPKTVLVLAPSFSGYEHSAACEDCQVRYYYLKKEDNFELTEHFVQELIRQIKAHEAPDLIFLANPNNPTGACISFDLLSQIVFLCCEHKITLVIDECFIEFTKRQNESLIKTAIHSSYLIVVRAFTKIYGIPGVRLGYLASSEKMVSCLKKQLPEWNVSLLAQYAGAAALQEDEFVQKTSEYVKKQRKYLTEKLRLLGLTVWQGEADYLLFYSEKNLYEMLLKKKMLIRDCSNYKGLESGYYRIAVKKQEENDRLIAALEAVLSDENIK